MPDLKPFIVSGIALGSVFSLSGVGITILFRATGVLNLAYGAIGAVGALTAWQLEDQGAPNWAAYLACVAVATGLSGLYGATFGPLLARRDPLSKATATLGFALVLLGGAFWYWSDNPRVLDLPSTSVSFDLGGVRANLTQILALALAVVLTVATSIFLRRTRLGVAMRALASDREISAVLGIRVRRIENAAWLGSGLICGISALLLANLVRLEAGTLTFLIIAALAAGVVGQFRSLAWTLVGGLAIGLIEAVATPFSRVSQYRTAAPFVVAIAVLLWMGRRKTVVIAQQAR
jgi:branched-chain amino acid transport system permease protein